MDKKIAFGTGALVLLAAGGVVAWCVMKSVPRKNPVAEIIQNGVLLETVPLSEDREFTISCAEGYNTVTIANGAVSVTAADCPDKVCVRTGAISGGATPIVCLPHRLEIRVVDGENSVDAVT